MLALGWQVTATMFQLTMSIREIFQEVSHRRAKYQGFISYTFAVVISSAQILALILIPVFVTKLDRLYYSIMVLITAYSMLTVAQSLILLLLLLTLGKMQRLGQFRIRNILLQFSLFLVSFLSNLGLYF